MPGAKAPRPKPTKAPPQRPNLNQQIKAELTAMRGQGEVTNQSLDRLTQEVAALRELTAVMRSEVVATYQLVEALCAEVADLSDCVPDSFVSYGTLPLSAEEKAVLEKLKVRTLALVPSNG